MAAEDIAAICTLWTSSQPPAVAAHYSKTGKKRSFNTAFKLEVVECAENTTNRGAGRIFGVDDKMVRDWRKHKQELISLPSTRKRLGRGGRKPVLPEMEDNLMLWITAQRAENCKVGRDDVQKKAIELAHGCKNGMGFTASRGWLDNFLRRKEIYLRPRKTGGGRRKPLPFLVNVEQQLAGEPVKVEGKNKELKEEDEEEGSLAYIL